MLTVARIPAVPAYQARHVGASFAPRKTRVCVAAVPKTVCRASNTPETTKDAMAVSLGKTAVIFAAALLLTSCANVDEAEAARSGGRVGGSRSFSSGARMRSAPRGPSTSGATVRNYNYYSAPPLISPYGGYGMFGGGLVMPFPAFGLGGLFNVMVLLFMVNIAVSVVQGLTNGRDEGRGKDDRWGDDGEDDRW